MKADVGNFEAPLSHFAEADQNDYPADFPGQDDRCDPSPSRTDLIASNFVRPKLADNDNAADGFVGPSVGTETDLRQNSLSAQEKAPLFVKRPESPGEPIGAGFQFSQAQRQDSDYKGTRNSFAAGDSYSAAPSSLRQAEMRPQGSETADGSNEGETEANNWNRDGSKITAVVRVPLNSPALLVKSCDDWCLKPYLKQLLCAEPARRKQDPSNPEVLEGAEDSSVINSSLLQEELPQPDDSRSGQVDALYRPNEDRLPDQSQQSDMSFCQPPEPMSPTRSLDLLKEQPQRRNETCDEPFKAVVYAPKEPVEEECLPTQKSPYQPSQASDTSKKSNVHFLPIPAPATQRIGLRGDGETPDPFQPDGKLLLPLRENMTQPQAAALRREKPMAQMPQPQSAVKIPRGPHMPIPSGIAGTYTYDDYDVDQQSASLNMSAMNFIELASEQWKIAAHKWAFEERVNGESSSAIVEEQNLLKHQLEHQQCALEWFDKVIREKGEAHSRLLEKFSRLWTFVSTTSADFNRLKSDNSDMNVQIAKLGRERRIIQADLVALQAAMSLAERWMCAEKAINAELRKDLQSTRSALSHEEMIKHDLDSRLSLQNQSSDACWERAIASQEWRITNAINALKAEVHSMAQPSSDMTKVNEFIKAISVMPKPQDLTQIFDSKVLELMTLLGSVGNSISTQIAELQISQESLATKDIIQKQVTSAISQLETDLVQNRDMHERVETLEKNKRDLEEDLRLKAEVVCGFSKEREELHTSLSLSSEKLHRLEVEVQEMSRNSSYDPEEIDQLRQDAAQIHALHTAKEALENQIKQFDEQVAVGDEERRALVRDKKATEVDMQVVKDKISELELGQEEFRAQIDQTEASIRADLQAMYRKLEYERGQRDENSLFQAQQEANSWRMEKEAVQNELHADQQAAKIRHDALQAENKRLLDLLEASTEPDNHFSEQLGTDGVQASEPARHELKPLSLREVSVGCPYLCQVTEVASVQGQQRLRSSQLAKRRSSHPAPRQQTLEEAKAELWRAREGESATAQDSAPGAMDQCGPMDLEGRGVNSRMHQSELREGIRQRRRADRNSIAASKVSILHPSVVARTTCMDLDNLREAAGEPMQSRRSAIRSEILNVDEDTTTLAPPNSSTPIFRGPQSKSDLEEQMSPEHTRNLRSASVNHRNLRAGSHDLGDEAFTHVSDRHNASLHLSRPHNGPKSSSKRYGDRASTHTYRTPKVSSPHFTQPQCVSNERSHQKRCMLNSATGTTTDGSQVSVKQSSALSVSDVEVTTGTILSIMTTSGLKRSRSSVLDLISDPLQKDTPQSKRINRGWSPSHPQGSRPDVSASGQSFAKMMPKPWNISARARSRFRQVKG